MKKMICVLLAAAFSLLLVACQPTPEETVVKGKSLDNLIDKATQPTESSGAQGTLAEKMGAQPTYQAELSDPNGKVKIHVNADVEIPDADSVSVDRVERSSVTQEKVDVLVKDLMKGKDMFSGDAYKLSKGEIQQKILETQAALAAMPPDEQNSKDPKRSGGAMMQAMLSDLQSQLETAPDTTQKVPTTGKLEPMEQDIYYTAGEKVHALAQSDAGYESLGVYNYEDAVNYVEYTSEKSAFSKNMGYFTTKEDIEKSEAEGLTPYISSAELEQIPDVTITVDDAKAKAEALIADLGLTNMVCYSADKGYGGSSDMTADQSQYANPRKCVWFLRYSRHVNNIPVTYTVWDCIKVEEDMQSTPWAYEDMTFAIDDTGIVGFSWRSPYNMAGTVTENSNLLSFNEITNVFNTMSLAVNAWDGLAQGNPNLVGIDITVDHIEFGLTRVTEQDKRDSGLLVPAWDFFGTMTYINQTDGQTKEYKDGPIPILTVNAIDGSIINRSLGY
jgi:hypothetical protein